MNSTQSLKLYEIKIKVSKGLLNINGNNYILNERLDPN